MTRCFIAVDMNDEIKEKIFNLQKEIKENSLKLVEKENLHITLLFLGEIDDNCKNNIITKLKTVKFNAFRAKINKLGFFPDSDYMRVIWIGVESPELISMARHIYSALEKKYDFTAHLTIARVKKKPGSELKEKLKRLGNTEIGEMTIDKFVLKKSTLTPEGPVYEDIEKFGSS